MNFADLDSFRRQLVGSCLCIRAHIFIIFHILNIFIQGEIQ